MRIVCDLDGTLIGERLAPNGEVYVRPRPGIHEFLEKLSRRGHRLVLWTAANAAWVRTVRGYFPALMSFFREIYTDDTLPAIDRARGYPRFFKNIYRVNGDVLIDNEPAFKLQAEQDGFGHRYILVPTFEPGKPDDSKRRLPEILKYIEQLRTSPDTLRLGFYFAG